MATDTLPEFSTDPASPMEAEFAAEIAAKVQAHPFLSRLATTEHEDQPTTANADADAMADGATDALTAQSEAPPSEPSATDTGASPAPSQDGAPVSASGPAAGYRLRDGDQDIELSDEQIRGMLALSQWAQQVAANEQLARQFGALEQGVAVAVPTDEYARYQAWLASGQSTVASRHPVADARGQVPEWVQDLDPEAQQAFLRLQADNAALAEQARLFEQQAVASRQPAVSAETDRIAGEFDQAITAYAQANNLTVDQASELLDVAVRANIIPNLTESQRQYSPSGVLVRDADYGQVARQALDFGRLQRPDLLAPAPTAPATPTPAPAAPAAQSAPTPDPVALKKARSASLAAAPSAATVPPGFDPRSATPQAQRDAMAKFLRDQGIAS